MFKKSGLLKVTTNMDVLNNIICFLTYIRIFLCFIYMGSASRIFSIYPMDMFSKVLPGGCLSAGMGRSLLLRVVGEGLSTEDGLFFTTSNTSCNFVRSTDTFFLSSVTHDNTSAIIKAKFKDLYGSEEFWYMCLVMKVRMADDKKKPDQVVHQGSVEWLKISVISEKEEEDLFLPLWLKILFCAILLVLSGLFSGLNLGLMALDPTELKIIERAGSETEKHHARRISPLRRRGNLLLCSLLLGNVLVNSTFTILFDSMTNGLAAVIVSTVAIVILGEIVPQAVCSRHGLAVGARTYWITVCFIIITFPAAFPISLVLDFVLGAEMGQAYSKEKLQELIRMTADQRILHDNEANIISGALQLTNKRVEDVMTKIEDVYMLEINTVLDFETITELMHQGYTRIPVYDGEKTNIVNLLNTKELALIDPDDKTLLSTVCKFYDHRPLFVDHDVTLDAMLQAFLQAGSSHMAIVQKLHSTGDQDPYFETMGVITLEDVIEEILQSEIVDETDLKIDNRQKGEPLLRRKEDYELLVPEMRMSTLPKQLAFAAFQFLTTTVEPFSDVHLARNVLKTLMRKDIVVTLSPSEKVTKKNYIYQKGVPSDKFVLILQGTVEVEIGDESMMFETGPFSYFGVECINRSRLTAIQSDAKSKDYVPDFSVRALSDVQYLCITRQMYIAALRTTKMLRVDGSSSAVSDAFDVEYEKVRRNENRSSLDNMSESSVLCPSTLSDTVKRDELTKKMSTASLDRPIFFHRKHDPLEGLYQKKQTGFDARDQSPEYSDKLDAMLIEPLKQTESETLTDGSDSFVTPVIPTADSKVNAPSSPSSLLPHNNQAYFIKELDSKNETDNTDEMMTTIDLEPARKSVPTKGLTTLEVTESTAGGDMQATTIRDTMHP